MHLRPRDLYDMGEGGDDEVYENEPCSELKQHLDQLFEHVDDLFERGCK